MNDARGADDERHIRSQGDQEEMKTIQDAAYFVITEHLDERRRNAARVRDVRSKTAGRSRRPQPGSSAAPALVLATVRAVGSRLTTV